MVIFRDQTLKFNLWQARYLYGKTEAINCLRFYFTYKQYPC